MRLRSLRPVQYLRRLGINARLLEGSDRLPDVVVFQKAYEEHHLRKAGELRHLGVRVVLDLCDNHFYNPAGLPHLTRRAHRLTQMIAAADLVTVSTPSLGELVDHPNVYVVRDALELPDRQDLAAVRLGCLTRNAQTPRVLWFGTAGAHDLPFGMRDLGLVGPDLGRLALRRARLLVASNSRSSFQTLSQTLPLKTSYFRWRRTVFPLLAGASDVAMLPVQVNPFTRPKTSNRVATALALGLPVVTDRLPSYEEDFGDCVLFGAHVTNTIRYLDDPELRQRHLNIGQLRVGEKYDPVRVGAQWADALRRAVDV